MAALNPWTPTYGEYKNWVGDQMYLQSFRNLPDKQVIAIRQKLNEQINEMSANTNRIIASNKQIADTVNTGFDRVVCATNEGFNRISHDLEEITTTIEDLHSSFNYHFEALIQQNELQNELLSDLISIAKIRYETEVRELYDNGVKMLQQGSMTYAKELFEDSIKIKTGKYFFPSNYRLGRIYLGAKDKEENLTDLKKALFYLSTAHELAGGRYRVDSNFKPVFADCKFFLSLAYYFQLIGKFDKTDTTKIDLLSKAKEYCEEAIELNPNLSQAYYHLAKYYAYEGNIEKMLSYLKSAMDIEGGYAIEVHNDGVFKGYLKEIDKLIEKMLSTKKMIAASFLATSKDQIATMERKPTLHFFESFGKYSQVKAIVVQAETNFQSGTFVGVARCLKELELLQVIPREKIKSGEKSLMTAALEAIEKESDKFEKNFAEQQLLRKAEEQAKQEAKLKAEEKLRESKSAALFIPIIMCGGIGILLSVFVGGCQGFLEWNNREIPFSEMGKHIYPDVLGGALVCGLIGILIGLILRARQK